MKKYNNKKYKYPKYDLGGFTEWGSNGQTNAQGIAGMAGMISPILGQGSRGAGALSGAASGASMGAALGPIGMGVGAVLGGTLGLISAGKEKNREEALARQASIASSENYGKQFNSKLDTNNQNAYGTQSFADGGYINKYPDGSFVDDKPLLTTKKGNVLTQNQWQNIQSNKAIKWTSPETYMNWVDGWAHPDEKNVANVANNAWMKTPGFKANYQDITVDNGISNPSGGSTGNRIYTGEQQRSNDSTQFVNQYRKDNQIVTNEEIMAKQKAQLKSMGIYANGSDVDSDNDNDQDNKINIEKGELQIDPQSGKILRQYAGINPETGGMYEPHNTKGKDVKHNIVNADEGSFIITKAKANEYKEATDNNDKLHLESIKMNIRNNKDAKLGTYKMGSFVKYANGSRVLPVNNMLNPITNGQIQNNYNPLAINQNPLGTQSVDTGSIYNPNQGKGLSSFTNTAAQYAPSLLNIGQGLFGKVEQQTRVQPQINPFQNEVINNMPQDISVQPVINELNKNLQGEYNRIDNSTSGSPIARANKNNMYGNYQDKLANIRLQGQQINNNTSLQRGSVYNQLGQQQVNSNLAAEGMNFQVDNINAQNRGAKQNILNAGLGQLQQTYQNSKSNNAKGYMDKSKIELLKQMFPNTKFYDNFDYSKFMEGLQNFKG